MADFVGLQGHPRGVAATSRTDRWWIEPVAVAAGLSAFVIYTTWAALQGTHYWYGPYLSPFYSPLLYSDVTAAGSAPVDHAWLGPWPDWWPGILPASPALLILMFPGLFRFTCYYYRKAYYRAFAWSPPACAVEGFAKSDYKGETRLLLFQNLHRYALYPALLYIVILYYDAFFALFKDGELGIGVGTVVLFVNATLLACYTFGCHSFRHLVGGRLDCYSCSQSTRMRHGVWKRATVLNRNHMAFAWLSLIWVGFTDLYIRLASMGLITDFNTWS